MSASQEKATKSRAARSGSRSLSLFEMFNLTKNVETFDSDPISQRSSKVQKVRRCDDEMQAKSTDELKEGSGGGGI